MDVHPDHPLSKHTHPLAQLSGPIQTAQGLRSLSRRSASPWSAPGLAQVVWLLTAKCQSPGWSPHPTHLGSHYCSWLPCSKPSTVCRMRPKDASCHPLSHACVRRKGCQLFPWWGPLCPTTDTPTRPSFPPRFSSKTTASTKPYYPVPHCPAPRQEQKPRPILDRGLMHHSALPFIPDTGLLA